MTGPYQHHHARSEWEHIIPKGILKGVIREMDRNPRGNAVPESGFGNRFNDEEVTIHVRSQANKFKIVINC